MVTDMRVMHVITKGDVGGAQTHLVELCRAQLRLGVVPTVIAGVGGPAVEQLRSSGIETFLIPSLAGSMSQLLRRSTLRQLCSMIRDVQPDIVHGHSSAAGLLARAAARRERCPSVYTAHGWPFQAGARAPQRAMSVAGESIGGRLGDAVICLTESEANLARRYRVARKDAIYVISNGLADVPGTQDRRVDPDQAPQVVMTARFAPPKLQHELIRALAEIIDLPWNLKLIGDGPQLDSCRRVGAEVLGDRVEFLGHRDDVAELLALSDVLVLWSRYEGMPIALLEGMRAGLCCVASDLPGVRTLFGTPPVGLTASTTPELVDALRRVLSESNLRVSLGRDARSRFEQHYSADVMAQATLEVYQRVISAQRRQRGRLSPFGPRN